MPTQIKPNIFWVGALDFDLRHFHGHSFTTKRGATYNSYLILDEKVTLIDGVQHNFFEQWLDRITEIIPLEKITQLIVNHIEPDHSSSIPLLLQKLPNLKLFGTQKCFDGLKKYYQRDFDFIVVKSGDEISTGVKTIQFLEAPMIHWPDSMFSYIPQDKLLLPNDAFGQHFCTNERFDNEVDQNILMEESAKYFANILWPFSSLILAKINQLKELDIDMVAPSHGLIWKNPQNIIDKYISWCSQKPENKAVIVYETMWNSTQKMAEKISEGIKQNGVDIQVFDIAQTDKTEAITALLKAKYWLFGSSTHDNDMLSNMAGFLHFLKGLKPINRITAVFGSFGWGGGATRSITEILTNMGLPPKIPALQFQFNPTKEELEKCVEFGKNLVKI